MITSTDNYIRLPNALFKRWVDFMKDHYGDLPGMLARRV